MTWQPGKQTITINILPDISRSKSNQTVKFGHLIAKSMRNSFLEKSCRPFSKKLKLGISLDQQSEVLSSLLLLLLFYFQVEDYHNILKLRCCPLAFTSYKDFLVSKRSWPSLPASFPGWFLKEYILHVIFY